MQPVRLISLLVFPLVAAVQLSAAPRLAPGVLLVADKDLQDRNFAKTVVVIADYSDEGTLGLVINRRTDVPLSDVLEKWKEATGVKDPIFMGGPVGRTGMFALIRSKTPPEGAKRVLGDIHLVTDRDSLSPHLAEGPARVRVYAGYTGWAADQLESEIADGGWHVLPANPKLIFDDDPDTLWLRLSHQAEMQVASANDRVERLTQVTNLYPTPWTVIRCLGSPCSSFARIPAM
jgi:putative transcriptional regulator